MRVVGFSHIVIYKFWLRIFIPAVLFSVSFTINADDTGEAHQHEVLTHEQNVESMLELMGMPSQVDSAAKAIIGLYSAKPAENEVDSDTGKVLEAYNKDLANIVQSILGWRQLKTSYIYSYSTRMSPLEVAAVTEFFRSSAGKKIVITQLAATEEIKSNTNHIIETDLNGPLTKLGAQLREGLAKAKKMSSQ